MTNAGFVFGPVPQWVRDLGLAPGDRVLIQVYAGMGRQGTEWKTVQARIQLIGEAGPVCVLSSDGRGARPVVVGRERFVRKM